MLGICNTIDGGEQNMKTQEKLLNACIISARTAQAAYSYLDICLKISTAWYNHCSGYKCVSVQKGLPPFPLFERRSAQ